MTWFRSQSRLYKVQSNENGGMGKQGEREMRQRRKKRGIKRRGKGGRETAILKNG